MIPCLSPLPLAASTVDGECTYMEATLAAWVQCGWLRALDAAFAGFLWREVPAAHPLLILAAALTSHQLGRGHVCLDLEATLADPAFALSLPPEGADRARLAVLPGKVLEGLTLGRWLAALDAPELVAKAAGSTPLVLDGSRLYLRRYWQYEQDVRGGIEMRLAASPHRQAALPIAALRHALDVLFADDSRPGEAGPDWQKMACALAARSAFAIITGGPGTGKTTTVVKLLALLQALELAGPPAGATARPLRIRLAAPTGKAAARLNASIAGAVARLPLDGLEQAEAIRAAVPVAVTTLHRLLGSRPDSRMFRHHAGNPLSLDVLVIDEASMVDLEMMAAVLAALPASARLILLGDKDQLASVEAGAVLGELCRRAARGHFSAQTCDWLALATGETVEGSLRDEDGGALDQAIAMLRHSHRFSAQSGIGRLAEAVNAGVVDAVARVRAAQYDDLSFINLSGADDPAFRSLVVDGGPPGGFADGRRGYRHYLEVLSSGRPRSDAGAAAFDKWAREVLAAHAAFQVLCAVRRGPWGVEGLNQRIAAALAAEGLVPSMREWYPGRPVLVTRNDYGLGLMNGDIGITLELPAASGGDAILRVAFSSGDGKDGIRWSLPSRLQAVETVFALTVHKSQGSEFEHAAMILPETPNPILTRELLYTGITRARRWFTLANPGGEAVERSAVERRVLRASGLMG